MRLLALLLLAAGLSPAAGPFLEKVNLFEAQTGGYEHYRIPAIVVTAKGSVLAFTEARKNPGGDWGPIDILMRRSTDGGRTWDAPRKVAHVDGPIQQNAVALEQGLAKPGEVTYNNVVPIVDRETGAIHLLFCVEYARAYSMSSDDDGLTFSKPVDITPTFERFKSDYAWRVLATGPGHGIQLQSGRLLVPVWLSNGTGGHAHRPSIVSVIYSDDHGRTWERGEIAATHPYLQNPSETLAIELVDGRVMLNIRHELPAHRRAIVYSRDGAHDWTTPLLHPQLVEPVCMGSIIRLSSKLGGSDRNRILFANPYSQEPRDPTKPEGSHVRQNVSVYLSYDEGDTWPVIRSVEPGVSGYSDLAVLDDGTALLFYERGSPSGSGTHVQYLTVARFNLEWLTEGKDTLGR
ncbi:MAG: exo-alpha-sialidase [Bryobacterales bacterium]|nr:exo-alpha-sialidase [Bryobacterales bacterium]